MADLRMEQLPDLREPIAVVAFAGWNDAASAATNAARFLTRRLAARRFASIDPERFYDFQATRPNVRVTLRGVREINWPANDLFYARNAGGDHDLVILIGVEPNLRWRTFGETLLGLFRDLKVNMVISLGALLADVAHTRDVRVTGTAADPEVAARLNLSTSRYEGPTGIVGVLHDSLRRSGVPAASLWANVPHYVTTDQNPPATLALLKRLQLMLGIDFDFTDLEAAGIRFVSEVDAAVSANPEIGEYVRRLEAASDAGEADDEAPELPPGEDLVMDVEDFLRSQRDDG